MAALRRNPRIIAIPRSLFSTLSPPSDQSTLKPPRSIKSTLRSETDPDKIAQIFHDSANSPGLRRDIVAFEITFLKLARSRRLDLIERLLDHQKSYTSKSEGFWVRIMTLYSRYGFVDQAVRTFDQMDELGCKRTVKSFCALLSVYLTNRQFDRVHECFADLPSKIGVSAEVISYNIVLKAFIEENKIEAAQSLLDTMEKEYEVKPDIISYNQLLSAYFKSKDELGFDRILAEIESKGLEPDSVTYNYRIHRLCRNKEISKAKDLMDEMISKKIRTTSISINAIIDGFCRKGDLESAKRVYGIGRDCEDVVINADTNLKIVRHLIKNGEFEEALEICKVNIKSGKPPPFEVLKGLVDGLVKMDKVDEAKEVIGKAKKRVSGDAVRSWEKFEGDLGL